MSVDGFSEYYQERAVRLKNLNSGQLVFELAVKPGADGEVNRLVFSFTDDGPGFDYQKFQQANKDVDELCFGRGLTLASSLCDQLQYSKSGRRVEVVYSLD